MFGPRLWWCSLLAGVEGCTMGQVLHGGATTTKAVRRTIQHSQESLRALARQGSRKSLASDDPEHVIVVPGRHFAPAASAGWAAAVSGDEVEGDLAREGEVAGGGAVAHATVVLTEGQGDA